MNHSRSNWDIIEDILHIIHNESKLKTHIMYRANLNSAQLGVYINHLLKNKLIQEEKNYYQITLKGDEVLDMITKLNAMIDDKNIYPQTVKVSERDSKPVNVKVRRYQY